MKRVLLLCCLFCVINNSFSQELKVFHSNARYGLLKGNDTIHKAIYNDIMIRKHYVQLVKGTNFYEGKKGILDKEGKVILPVEYDYISSSSLGDAFYVKGNDSVFLYYPNVNKRTIIPPNKSNFHFRPSEGRIQGFYWIDGKVGFVDSEMKDIHNKMYERLGFANGKDMSYCIKENGKLGFIDHNGKITVPLEHDAALGSLYGVYGLKKDGKWSIVNSNGLSFEYDSLVELSKTRIAVMKGKKFALSTMEGRLLTEFIIDELGPKQRRKWISYKSNGFMGIIDSNGQTVFLPKYEFVSKKAQWTNSRYFSVRNREKWGVIDSNGTVIIDPIYDDQVLISKRYKYLTSRLNGKEGIIDTTGNVVVPFKYKKARFTSINKVKLFLVMSEDYKYGYLSEQGQLLINIEFDNYKGIGGLIIGVRTIKKTYPKKWVYTFFDVKGNELFSNEIDWYDIFRSEKIIRVNKGDRYGYITFEGKVLSTVKYLSAGVFKNGKAEVSEDGTNFYFIDKSGKKIK